VNGRRRRARKPVNLTEFFREIRQLPLFDSRTGVSMKKLLGDWRPESKR
jgi:hypothetical protein